MNTEEYKKMFKLETTHWWFLAKQKFISIVFPKINHPKILDIGAGTGGTTQFLQHYGLVTGLEVNQTAIDFARKRGLKIIKGSAAKLPFNKNIFDVVCFFDVLYHQQINDVQALKEAYRILKPGGYLIVTDCAFEFLRGPHDKAVKARERYIRGELVAKIEKVGFVVQKASYIFWLVFPLTIIKRLIDRYRAKFTNKKVFSDTEAVPKTINSILLTICNFEAKLLKYLNLPWGSSIIIRVQKAN